MNQPVVNRRRSRRLGLHQRDPGEIMLVKDACRAVPGPPVTESTIHRWARSGVKNTMTGANVKLRMMRVGSRSATTPAALLDFFQQLGEQP